MAKPTVSTRIKCPDWHGTFVLNRINKLKKWSMTNTDQDLNAGPKKIARSRLHYGRVIGKSICNSWCHVLLAAMGKFSWEFLILGWDGLHPDWVGSIWQASLKFLLLCPPKTVVLLGMCCAVLALAPHLASVSKIIQRTRTWQTPLPDWFGHFYCARQAACH